MRLTLVPALLTVLRERSWWIPRWFEKLLPDITIEPPAERPAPGGAPQPAPAIES
jgi:RND superfamily putative drug exporter